PASHASCALDALLSLPVTVVAQTSIIALPSPSLSLLAVAIAPTAHDTRLRRNTPRGSPHVAVARQTSVKVSRHPDHLTHDVRAQESHWYVTDSKLKPP
ncbi:hypothetical protein B0T11DRAFT_334115, partial [Plectosphaerella cucumerina]